MSREVEIIKQLNERLRILCHLSVTDENGVDRYFAIAVKPAYYLTFCELKEIDSEELEKYGEILHVGEGLEPTPQVMAELKEKFGADYDFADDLQKEIELASKS